MTGRRWVAAIGAGREQIPAIERCRAAGFAVVALDGNPSAPGLAIADDRHDVDLTDVDAVLATLRRHDVEWCVPAPVGRALATVGEVNDRLGLPGITGDAAAACVDKDHYDRVVRAAGARRPRRLLVRAATEIVQALLAIGPPCVLKPARGSGSRGVTVCLDQHDVDRAAHATTEVVPGPWLVEEFLAGEEVGVDALVMDGRVRPVLVRDKVMTPLPDRQELGYDVPTRHPVAPIVDELQRCVDALGLDRCVVNADVVITTEGPTVIELAGRPAGLLVAEHLVRAATDVDLLGLAIELQRGRPVAEPPAQLRRAVALRFLGDGTGEGDVVHTPSAEALRTEPGVVHADVWARPGDRLRPVRSAADVLARGVVITTGTDRADAARRAEHLATTHPILVRADRPLGVS